MRQTIRLFYLLLAILGLGTLLFYYLPVGLTYGQKAHRPSQGPREQFTRRNPKWYLNEHSTPTTSQSLTALNRCLNASNMTQYFADSGYMKEAESTTQAMLDSLHTFIPKNFSTAYRNHCWKTYSRFSAYNYSSYEGDFGRYHFQVNGYKSRIFNLRKSYDKQLRYACLPELFLAGFPKCGSTFLFSLLTAHPDIAKPFNKEPNWWVSNDIIDETMATSDLAFHIAEYVYNFYSLAKMDFREIISVDATPGLLFQYPKSSSPVNYCLLPAVLPQVLPNAKYLVVVRNPVTFLYSSFWYSCTRHHAKVPMEVQLKGPDIFHERITKKIKLFKDCITQYPVAKCLMDGKADVLDGKLDCGRARLSTAIYYVHIQKWLSTIPRSQFFFTTLEHLYANTPSVLTKLWEFLGLRDVRGLAGRVQSNSKAVHEQVTVDYRTDPRLMMRNETKAILREFFKPYNEKLARLIQSRDLW